MAEGASQELDIGYHVGLVKYHEILLSEVASLPHRKSPNGPVLIFGIRQSSGNARGAARKG